MLSGLLRGFIAGREALQLLARAELGLRLIRTDQKTTYLFLIGLLELLST